MLQHSVAGCNIAIIYLISFAGRSNFVDSLDDVVPWCDVPYTPQNMLQLALWLFCSIAVRHLYIALRCKDSARAASAKCQTGSFVLYGRTISDCDRSLYTGDEVTRSVTVQFMCCTWRAFCTKDWWWNWQCITFCSVLAVCTDVLWQYLYSMIGWKSSSTCFMTRCMAIAYYAHQKKLICVYLASLHLSRNGSRGKWMFVMYHHIDHLEIDRHNHQPSFIGCWVSDVIDSWDPLSYPTFNTVSKLC